MKPDSGLWMIPYRGILPAHVHSPVDLVYLDSNYRVIQEIESFLTSTVEPLKDEAASALVLPAHTIYSSQTQPGDQMVICVADEMERRLERLSGSIASMSNSQSVVATKEKHSGNGSSAHAPLQIRSASRQTTDQGKDTMDNLGLKTGKRGSLLGWIQNWLSSDRRRAPRQPLPGLVAYYWTGSTPRAYQIADISSSGFYVLTEERWFPGTMVLMTLQRTDSAGKNLDDSIAVQSRVVRWGSDGLGLAFVLSKAVDPNSGESMRENGADKKMLERFLERLKDSNAELRFAGR
ncbi:MAG TPA: PilZ domain-containing protein [Terracidiphilus sp.]|nr:PilZ domain-containing protein [Terracidiphilus sp.]